MRHRKHKLVNFMELKSEILKFTIKKRNNDKLFLNFGKFFLEILIFFEIMI